VTYTVRWTRKAQDRQLTNIWLAATDRRAVTAAAHQVDQLLRTDPASQGESRSGNRRLLIVRPLAVMFKVIEAERRVVVFSVRPYGAGPPRP
jgi:plasmid stabilization system protein ParE